MDPTRRLWPRSDLRVGDSDRKTVVDELQRHYIEGRLTSEELGERVSHALSARTFGDLSTLLSDLPVPPDANILDAHQPPDVDAYDHHQWRTHTMVPPLGVVLLVLGLLFMVMMFAMPMGRGFVFPWPLLIWGFFFIGRPWRGGGRRF